MTPAPRIPTLPVIAIHGSASAGVQWRRLRDHLGAAYEVATPDLPGYGARARGPQNVTPTVGADAAAITRAIMAAGGPVHLIGHSYGGAIALKAAMRNPSRIASLTLIEPAIFHLLRAAGPAHGRAYEEIASLGEAIGRALHAGAPEHGVARFIDYWNGAGAWASMKPPLRAALATQAGQIMRNFTAALSESWELGEWAGSGVAPLMILGERTREPARAVSELMAAANPGARLTRLAEAGHMSPISHPDLVNSVIATHLDAHEAARAKTPLPAAA